MRKKPQWWILPGIITASLAGLGAFGTFIVKSADYIKLPDLMAEQTKRNDSQDQRLDKLITLQEYQQSANQQAPNQRSQPQQERESSHGLREWDDTDQTFWCCSYLDRQRCFDQELWRKCD